jgi:hypothetical protein
MMNGAIYTASTQKGGIGCIHDGIHSQTSDVSPAHLNAV